MKQIIKRIISVVLCYLFVLSVFPSAAIVASAEDYIGSGTEADPYIVSSQDQLTSILSTHNTSDTYIKLDSDITLDSSYLPISELQANIDGDFHTITAQKTFCNQNYGTLKNFYYTNTVTIEDGGYGRYVGVVCHENYGLISGVIATGEISNLTCNSKECSAEVAGIIAGTCSGNNALIVNCAAFGSINVYCGDGSHAGGITNSGNVVNCYARVSISATGGSRYGTSTSYPICAGSPTNSYSLSIDDMKSYEFVDMLNSYPVATDSVWVKDTQNINSGYPILQRAFNATVTSSKTNVLLSGSESIRLTCNDATATIYYTLDGSQPTTNSTKYTAPITIRNSTTLTVIAYKNGLYSSPKKFLYANVLGSGTTQDPYQINSEAALNAIPELSNTGIYKYVLTQNIDLTEEFPSLGIFSGHFDGQGYRISNVHGKKSIYGFTQNNYGIIENLTLQVNDNKQLTAKAGFAYVNYGVIYNCRFEGKLHSQSYPKNGSSGGIACENHGRIEFTSFNGYFYSESAVNGGGLVGKNTGHIYNCTFNGRVYVNDIDFFNGQGYIGGLIGYNNGLVAYCQITATSVAAYTRSYVGVYVGSLLGGGNSVVDCTGSVDSVDYYRINYIEWGSCAINTNFGTNSGNPIPDMHDHDFYLCADTPICGQRRKTHCICDCGIEIDCEWYDNYYDTHMYVETVIDPTCTEEGKNVKTCEKCGYESVISAIPSLGHRVILSDDTWVDSISSHNDAKYPFSYSNGTYSSTNKSHSTNSTYTFTALYDCTLRLEYSVSSEQNYDKLIIKKNSTTLYTLSGTVSWTAVDISLKAGDILTVSYTKDGSVSKGSDAGYFKFSCSQTQIGSKVESLADECEPTCESAVVCSYCQKVVKNALGHSYSKWEVHVDPCEHNDGLKTRECSTCGNEVFEKILFASGDVDSDGVLSNSDITLAVRAIAGFDTENAMRLDTNYDGILNNRDVIAFIQKLAGWTE